MSALVAAGLVQLHHEVRVAEARDLWAGRRPYCTGCAALLQAADRLPGEERREEVALPALAFRPPTSSSSDFGGGGERERKRLLYTRGARQAHSRQTVKVLNR